MSFSASFAKLLVWLNFLWTVFLIYDARGQVDPPPKFRQLGLLCHNIPALFLLGTTLAAQRSDDKFLVWFIALMAFRYWRTLVSIYFWFQHELAVATPGFKINSGDCTVVVPTVDPAGNKSHGEMVAAILVNRPAKLIISTNTAKAEQQVKSTVLSIRSAVEAGTTTYQKQHGLGACKVVTKIEVLNADVSHKRQQVVRAFSTINTNILVMVDDSAIWHPHFLQATLPAFQSEKVGFVGTRKWVKRLPQPRDPNLNVFAGIWQQYVAGFWNTIGGAYLIRHNFETRATNASDGGVFCVSGRSSLIRTKIVKDDKFTQAFTNEYIFRLGKYFPGWGPVAADDDVFLTRWVINHGYDIKMQFSKEATMTTTLGTYPLKFPDQCKRWSRSGFRQIPIQLFVDRTVWWKWPLTVWTTNFPWLYNAALVWDTLAVYTFTHSQLYAHSTHRTALLCSLVVFIWLTKLVKTMAWFWAHPVDFVLYFIIPAYPLFVYWHSLLKIYTAFTFWDRAWSGRKLK
ncbi:hypothetical protein IQ06DRAFT_362088 [Phaeosphaeriaceae sp. SRC1lsM3a]|nr:hypothetical protein IQ06DRAFT_362088 [Stagonospora sp. SRC1lsM3a]